MIYELFIYTKVINYAFHDCCFDGDVERLLTKKKIRLVEKGVKY